MIPKRKETLERQPKGGWVCLWERFVQQLGLVLVHDGQRNPGQFEFPPEEVRFYTKTYQVHLDGQPVKTWVKFRYDLREGEVGVDLTWREPDKNQKETMEMSIPEIQEVVNG